MPGGLRWRIKTGTNEKPGSSHTPRYVVLLGLLVVTEIWLVWLRLLEWWGFYG
jgi:hypothetical protein